jgi:3-deoxy-manno-octulosonate cytidylyltransferase (CMP-KDO synthetase)
MVEEVWRRARRAAGIDRLVIATDDERIRAAAEAFGAEVALTSPDHPSGTDRVAEVAERLGPDYGVVVNIQGDEPLLTPTSLDRLVEVFSADPPPQMATLAEPVGSPDELFDPNVVKLITRSDGRALYFSRSPIPFYRGGGAKLSADFRRELDRREGGLAGFRKHQGIYAYGRQTLQALTRLEPSPLERDEGLEQLRALQAGFSIQVVDSDFHSMSVDTPADLERVTALWTEAD